MSDRQDKKPELESALPTMSRGADVGPQPTTDNDAAPTLSGPDTPQPVDQSTQTMPDSIGEYRIVGLLGQGGMGVVWEAEQQQPRRRVALKVMRQGHYVDDLHARMFRREAEVLGRLKHPNIAAIYESGHTEDGHDFFAMELVRGLTLAEWLAQRPHVVTTEELRLRLRLFRTICEAVNYAHQRGVIHRDLKPSNIILTEETSSAAASAGSLLPAVKILDFGLARVTDVEAMAASVLTEVGMIKGTLQYMAPEQARGEAEAIDVRTDVYALGVILYELVAGRRPYDVVASALAEAVRVICEEPPQSLSQGWSGTRKLDHDVETIVAKALEKDPERRYGSATALSDDVERYLSSQPIMARPPSAGYRFRKMVRRHRALVGGAAVLLVVLVAASLVSTTMYLRARTEAAKAEQAAAFLGEMLTGVGPSVARGRDTTMLREILDRTATRVSTELSGQPEVAAGIHQVLGQTYQQLGELEEAESHVNTALASHRKQHDGDHPAVAQDLRILGTVKWNGRKLGEAEALFRQVLDMRHALPAAPSTELADVLTDLGNVLTEAGRHDEAEPLIREGLAMKSAVLGAEHESIAVSLTSLGNLMHFRGAFEDAEPLYNEALAMHRLLLGDDHPTVAVDLENLGRLHVSKGDLDAADRLVREALELNRSLYGGDHPRVAECLSTLGTVQRRRGDWSGAETSFRSTLEMRRRIHGDDTAPVADAINDLAVLVGERQGPGAGVTLQRGALAIHRRTLAPDDPVLATDLVNLAFSLAALREFTEAEALYREGLSLLIARLGEHHPRVLLNYNNLARLYKNTGDLDAAEAMFRKVLAGRRKALGEQHDQVAVTMGDVASVLRERGLLDAAEKMLSEALILFDATLGAEHAATLVTHASHGRVLCDLERFAEAEPELRASRDSLAAIYGPNHPRTLIVNANLARAVAAVGDAHDAEELFKTIFDAPPGAIPETYLVEAHLYLGIFFADADRHAAAEGQLLAAEKMLQEPRGGAVRSRIAVFEALFDLYSSWDAVHPGQGYAATAAEWQARLEM